MDHKYINGVVAEHEPREARLTEQVRLRAPASLDQGQREANEKRTSRLGAASGRGEVNAFHGSFAAAAEAATSA